MIDFNITNEEKEALKYYESDGYKAINQILISNSESDIALLSDEVENEVVSIKYDRESIIKYLNTTKILYRLILKKYYKNNRVYNTTFYRGTNLAEVEQLKISPYIDKFIIATVSKEKAENTYSSKWNRPVSMNITLLDDIPYLKVSDVIDEEDISEDVLILPFTKIKSMEETSEKTLKKNAKTVKIYNVELEKQKLDGLSEDERWGLYKYILDNSMFIGRSLEECISLEKENALNFENIRKLEQLLNKYEINEEDEEDDLDDGSIEKDTNSIDRLEVELNELKKLSTNLFEKRKEKLNFINIWKRNIAVYMIAECAKIEEDFSDVINERNNFKDETIKIENTDSLLNISSNIENVKAEIIEEEESKEETTEENTETVIDETIPNALDENTEYVKDEDVSYTTAMLSCNENIKLAEEMQSNIKALITRQQNYAKIAGNVGASYSALNNAFEMRKQTGRLLADLEDRKYKVDDLKDEEDSEKVEMLKEIAKENVKISNLLKELNNSKIVAQNSNVTRFEEMEIIEENELKRAIAERIRYIRGEAELRKLKDDLEIINDKTTFEKIIGFFTGRNKLDEFMIEQIDIRQKAIRKTLAKKMSLAYNYSIHELIAEILMFIEDNEDDELVESDIKCLQDVSNELKKNFAISDFKVRLLLDKKENKNLPVEKKKLSKEDVIEIETYRFLNKYGYDISKEEVEEPKYHDTMANEIEDVIKYINDLDN